MILIPLERIQLPAWGADRRREPVRIGIPLGRGQATAAEAVAVVGRADRQVPCHAQALDRWPDGSIRWLLLDFLADSQASLAEPYLVRLGEPAAPHDVTCRISSGHGVTTVETGQVRFEFRVGGRFPISDISRGGRPLLASDRSGVEVDAGSGPVDARIQSVTVVDRSPMRAVVDVRAGIDTLRTPRLELSARVEIFAGTEIARIDTTIANTGRASHPNGHWELGDPGSLLLTSLSLTLRPTEGIQSVQCSLEEGSALTESAMPLAIHQESSGGEHWNSPVHVDRSGRVPLRYRGYRFTSGGIETAGNRASPIVVARNETLRLAVSAPKFWQNFPRSIAVDTGEIRVGLFPAQVSTLHELQAGEQKTHAVVVSFGDEAVSNPPLAWTHDPVIFYPPSSWCCSTGAIPFLVPATDDEQMHRELVQEALEPVNGFVAKRERQDEYGWRNFGDLPADHESAFQPPGEFLVSHYNNQYDAIAAFAVQFLRSGHPDWWRLMEDLVRHVRDIDIYRTTEDKAAYNGGLFWHTAHYTDAGRSTHRSYPVGSHGGGPSAEHNYNTGLMLHYFMTGQRASKDAAVGLARWVLDMDDPGKSPFRWLAGGPTGLASSTGSPLYHGPGRGAANSILACLVGHRLTGENAFKSKTEELIRRCVHPEENLEALNLLDIERRWYYTVFLQALGLYLYEKEITGEHDQSYWYTRASLLRFAAWIRDNERPYLSQPEQLEFPTETWAAQDLRKAEVLLFAARYTDDGDRARLMARADFFFHESLASLSKAPTHRYARPTILLLTQAVRRQGLIKAIEAGAAPEAGIDQPPSFGPRTAFEPQKVKALARVRWILAVAGLTLAVVLASVLW